MKIGIISVNNAHNFGTSMQALSLKHYLESLGHSVNIINYRNRNIEKSYRICRNIPSNKIKYFLKYLKEVIKKPYIPLRRQRYEKFFQDNFNLTQEYKSLKQLRNAKLEFDVIFLGSDQIWNSSITKGLDPAFFGDFAKTNTIIASYGASIGNSQVAERELPVFTEYFKKMDYISVREENAKKLFSQLCDKEISVVCDPTLLPRRDYLKSFVNKKSPFKNKEYIYVHVHHFSAKAPQLVKAAKILSKKTGLPIVHNLQTAKFKKELGKTRNGGPIETLNAIAHSKYVLTQSFHISVFSILLGKNFITLKRERNNDRMENLFSKLGILEHFADSNKPLPDFKDIPIDFNKVYKKIDTLRADSIKFIERVLKGEKCRKTPDYFESLDKFTCYGCYACKDSCPTQAIFMQKDEEGFYQPVIDRNLCINCNKCSRVCPYNNTVKDEKFKSVGYMAYAKGKYDLENSASGGVFPVFAKNIISKGGYVVGVKYSKNLTAVYDIVNTWQEAKAFKGSKYVEAEHNNIYKKVEKILKQGKTVLFTGTPCKIAGLKNFLGKEYKNLVILGIICACTSSQKVLEYYLKDKSAQKGSPVTSVTFRDKSKGWNNVATTLTFKNGKKESAFKHWDIYYHCFVSAFLAKRSCFRCQFTGDNKLSDIIMGDFWGYKKINPNFKADKNGVSAIVISTKKGMSLFDEVKENFAVFETEVCDIYNNNHNWPIKYTPQREEIFKCFSEQKFDTLEILKKFNSKYNKPQT